MVNVQDWYAESYVQFPALLQTSCNFRYVVSLFSAFIPCLQNGSNTSPTSTGCSEDDSMNTGKDSHCGDRVQSNPYSCMAALSLY